MPATDCTSRWRRLGERLPAGNGLTFCDSRFLDRIATHILAFEGDSQAFWFPGKYGEYEEDRYKRLGQAANRPHRITYRKLRRA